VIRVYPGGRIRTATAIHRVDAYIPPGKESGGYAVTDEGILIWDRDFTVLKHLPDLCDVKKEKREEWSRYRYQLIRELHEKKKKVNDST
jgi:hypothetical protein